MQQISLSDKFTCVNFDPNEAPYGQASILNLILDNQCVFIIRNPCFTQWPRGCRGLQFRMWQGT